MKDDVEIGHNYFFGFSNQFKEEYERIFGMAKKAKLGTGKRFKALTKKLSKKGAKNPKALAAYIGRKKYGKAKFQNMASKGRKRKARR